MNVSEMRMDYTRDALHRRDLDPDPFAQFETWFKQACDSGMIEPNAMSLATVDAEGRPTLRTVLLKKWDRNGFVFFTNIESRKAAQIERHPHVSLLFPWLLLQRQVAINGPAERIPTSEVLAYFVTRPFGSQLAAWASPQSKVVSTRSLLEAKWDELKRKFREGQVPLPSFWGGYRVQPRDFEFWQGRTNRLHDRFQYVPAPGGGWRIERLAP